MTKINKPPKIREMIAPDRASAKCAVNEEKGLSKLSADTLSASGNKSRLSSVNGTNIRATVKQKAVTFQLDISSNNPIFLKHKVGFVN